MLPSIQGHLASTRQPLDFVGSALDAFLAVSAEMRATRAQNQSEARDAQQAGQQAFERPMQARAFQEELIDTALDRKYAAQDQQMQLVAFQAEMERAEWAQQNLAPLQLETERARLDEHRSRAESRRYQIQSETNLREQFGQEMNDLHHAFQLVSRGPQEGQEAEAYYESIRQTKALYDDVVKTWGDTQDPAIVGGLNSFGAQFSRLPGYRYLEANGNLDTAEKRDARRRQREIILDSTLPFQSDTEREAWYAENPRRLESWQGLPDEAFREVVKAEAERISKRQEDFDAPGFNAFRESTTADRNLLLRRNTAASAGRSFILDEDGVTKIPIEIVDRQLRGIGFGDSDLESMPAEAGENRVKSFIDSVR